jgi:arabinofuranan 3-O-arabinosyltransferase
VPGRALERLVQQGAFVDVRASSSGVADPRGSVLAAVDGDPATTWSAAGYDVRPTVTLSWLRPQRLESIEVGVDANTAARAPQSLLLRWDGGRRTVSLGTDGRASFAPIRTDELTVEVQESEPATSVDFGGATSPVPVGITDLGLGGAESLPLRVGDEALDLPCGTGPDLVVNGVRQRTTVVASARELLNGVAVPATPCGADAVTLRPGDNTISLTASDAFTPLSAVLGRADLPVGSGAPVAGSSDGRGAQRLVPEQGQRVVAGHQNANPGWEATQAGEPVESVVVDGWRQGWRTSGAESEVRAEFAPGSTYRFGLLVGAGAMLLLLALVAVGARRRGDGMLAGPAPERSLPGLVLVALVPAVGALLAGPGGLLAASLGGPIVWLVSRIGLPVARGIVAAAVMPAIGAFAFRPWGGGDGWAGSLAWPSYLVVFVVSGLLVLLVLDSPRRILPLRRSAGSSTVR